MVTADDLKIPVLGEARHPSPISVSAEGPANVLFHNRYPAATEVSDPPAVLEGAGARDRIYFEPAVTKAGIVTCGGLCPGLNDVIRGLVMVLWHRYGVRDLLGFRYGYEGLVPGLGQEPMPLTPESVDHIHEQGGTVLGSSRGPQDAATMVDGLIERGVNLLFCLGGDGTLRGALQLSQEARRRGADLAVVGLPKTIDNDIMYVQRSFGVVTAASRANEAVVAAHNEAKGARRGVGLVKLMGRQSGFIAAGAALANGDVNFVLVPEVDFPLEGQGGFLDALGRRLDARGHAVVVVAEGAGQAYCPAIGKDASGNQKFGDVGVFLRDRICDHFRQAGCPVSMKYIDPSYTIRGCAASALDSAYCFRLAAFAVHAGMAGKTELIVGQWHGRFVHIPIALAVSERQRINPQGELWAAVLDATGQPRWGAATA